MTETGFGKVSRRFRVEPLATNVFFQEGPGLRKWQWTDEGMKVINVTNILSDGRVDIDNTDRHIGMTEFEDKYSHFAVEEGDIVVASSGNTYGKVGRISSRHLPLMMNTSVIRFHSKDSQLLDANYLYAFIRSPLFRNQIEQFVIGSAQPNFGPTHLMRMMIVRPDIDIQRRIAAILSAYDDLIENNTRRIAILEEMARRLYEEWFVHFRFPGHEDVKMVESEIGQVPEGWEVMPLASVAEVNAESIRKGNTPQEIRYIDIKSVSTGRVKQVREMAFADAPSRARRVVNSGDILWSSVRPNLRAFALLLDPPPNTIASTGFAIVSPRQAPFSFLYPGLTTNEFVEYLINHATGTAYPAVNQKDFEAARLVVPPSKLLETYDQIARPMFVLAHRLDLKDTNLRAQRDLLLPKLIAGEIGVADIAEPKLEAAE